MTVNTINAGKMAVLKAVLQFQNVFPFSAVCQLTKNLQFTFLTAISPPTGDFAGDTAAHTHTHTHSKQGNSVKAVCTVREM